jgi:hypothetical protein
MILAASQLTGSRLLEQRIEAIGMALIICGLIFELVRRRRLTERYAILWLLAGFTVLVLALWKGLLTTLAHAAGISYLPSALFGVAFLFVLLMLVHFSTTISRLAHQNTTLAQRLALLQERLEREVGRPVNAAHAAELLDDAADELLAQPSHSSPDSGGNAIGERASVDT